MAGRRADRLLQIGVALDENLDSTVLHINTLALVESPPRGLRSAHATTWNVFLWGLRATLMLRGASWAAGWAAGRGPAFG